MIDKREVIEFFNGRAAGWDSSLKRNDEAIDAILNNACVHEGSRVLDVACGTGVLVSDYLKRGVSSVTAIDISAEMIRVAKSKIDDNRVEFVCGDVEIVDVGNEYDSIVVYNAFPHFPDGERLIARLSKLLKDGGILTVAHGSSREKIDACHRGAPSRVSNGLLPVEDLAEIFRRYLIVGTVVSNDSFYQVTGKRFI